MAVFKYYNIQLLPLDSSKTQMVGASGYQRLFKRLGDATTLAVQRKQLDRFGAQLRDEKRFAPFGVRIEKEYSHGLFVKFKIVEEIQDLYEGGEPQPVGPNKVDQRLMFRFLFEYKVHTLAIQLKAGLPSAWPLIKAFYDLLEPIAATEFPEHTLSVTELTSSESLSAVLSADAYKRVNIDVTFSNSADLNHELIAQLESEARENNIHSIEHIEKPAEKAQMPSMSDYAAALLGLAAKYGNATVRYVKNNAKKIYKMADYPVKRKVKADSIKNPEQFIAELRTTVKAANEEAQEGVEVKEKLRNENK